MSPACYSHAASRQREIAIRRAIGANRWQIVRQLLAEGLVLVAGGTAAGLALDAFLRNQLSNLRWPSAYGLPFEFHFHQDTGLLLYASAAAFAALLVCSLIPALRGSYADLTLVIKQGEPAFSIQHWRGSSGLVALHVMLSMVLLTLGALFTRSFVHLVQADPGFDVAHTLIVGIQSTHEPRLQVFRRVAALPGVLAVSSTEVLPLAGEMPRAPLRRPGEPLSSARDVYRVGAGPQYCAAIGLRLLEGRDLALTDLTHQPASVVVNQTLAREFFGTAGSCGRGRRRDGAYSRRNQVARPLYPGSVWCADRASCR